MRDTKTRLLAWGLIMTALLATGCSVDDDDELLGDWIKRSDFEGVARANAASFVIGDYAYVCGGHDGSNRLNDLWEYNLSKQYWTQKASMPGKGRHYATAFTIGQSGYVGLGYDGDYNLGDFYRYDRSSDSWTQIADYGGSARYGSVAFSVGGKGYVGTGYDGNYLMDFYCYNPSSDSWTQTASIGGSKRQGASSFVFNYEAYVVCGENNGSYVNDFWKYDYESDSWTELRKISNVSSSSYDDDYDVPRSYAACFTIGGKAYVACGYTGSIRGDVWEYNPATDLWKEKTSFEGSAREGAVGFTLEDRGFLTTGRSVNYRFEDMWELLPDEEQDDENG